MTRALPLLLAAVLVALFLYRPFSIKTDIMALLPESEANDIRQEAFNHVSASSMGLINILFAADDFDTSKEAGLYFLSLIEGYEVSYLLDDQAASIKALGAYSSHLLSAENRRLIEAGQSDVIAEQAVQALFGAVSAPMDMLNDPFMLAPSWLMSSNLLKSGFSPRQSLLSADYGGQIYTYMSIRLDNKDVFSPSKLAEIMTRLDSARSQTEQGYPVKLNITGIPVHTYAASSGSMRETTIISIISFIIILALIIAALRSIAGFICAIFTIAAAFGVAFMLTAVVFGEVHVLTIVFGTSLIGLSIDYCLHYLIERPCYADSQTPLKVIRMAISISLATTITGFAALMSSNMPLLRQMALFSIAGLGYVYLFINCLYPSIFRRISMNKPPQWLVRVEQALSGFVPSIISRRTAAVFLLICAIGILQLRADDDLRYLYKPEAKLMEAEALFAKVSQQNFSAAFFFVSGENAEAVLQNEEKLRQRLDAEIEAGNLSGYKAISQLVPSIATQQESYRLTSILFKQGLLRTYIGVEAYKRLQEAYAAQMDRYFTVDKAIELQNILETFWLPNSGSVVLLEGVRDDSRLLSLQSDSVYYMNKIDDLSATLTSYRHKTTIVICIAFIIILALLILRYGLRRGLIACIPSIAAILSILAFLGYMGGAISFFHVIGLFLVLCFGIDYTVFQVETEGKLRFAGLAIMLSCITTLASFGLLAFTSFEVTKALGVTLFVGILLSYLFSGLARTSNR